MAHSKRRLAFFGSAVLFISIGLSATAYIISGFARATQESNAFRIRAAQKDLEEQITALKTGQRHSIWLYDSRGTDALLLQLEGLPQVEELTLELTDVSADGFASIAKPPNLHKLHVYYGRGTNDLALAHLRGMSALRELELRNPQVTNNGLRELAHLPNLRSLTLYCEPRLGTLNDEGLTHLKGLANLERLIITGGWASESAVADLRAQLPHCKFSTESK